MANPSELSGADQALGQHFINLTEQIMTKLQWYYSVLFLTFGIGAAIITIIWLLRQLAALHGG